MTHLSTLYTELKHHEYAAKYASTRLLRKASEGNAAKVAAEIARLEAGTPVSDGVQMELLGEAA